MHVRNQNMTISSWLCITALLCTLSQAAQQAYVTFPGPDGVTLSGVLYTPMAYNETSCYTGMVLMHGCSGIWSQRRVNKTSAGTWDLQNHLEKWALKLASENVVALAVDSFTPRAPPDVESKEWQYQCNDGAFPNNVSAYTTRVQDARAGWHYLASLGTVWSSRIGLLGWSHGAEATMVEAGATPRDRNEARADHLFAVLVGFYPGCGNFLGFGDVATSFWRPYMEFSLNVGEKDGFHANCQSRVQTSRRDYPTVIINFPDYDLAGHSFDHESQIWPTRKCSGEITLQNADVCAMNAADIDSLAFVQRFLLAPGPAPCGFPPSSPADYSRKYLTRALAPITSLTQDLYDGALLLGPLDEVTVVACILFLTMLLYNITRSSEEPERRREKKLAGKQRLTYALGPLKRVSIPNPDSAKPRRERSSSVDKRLRF